ncbi:DUF3072 domain-containing protein [Rhizobium sp. SIMBA_035]
MTRAQPSYLKSLAVLAHLADTFSGDLTKAEASKRIEDPRQSLDLE